MKTIAFVITKSIIGGAQGWVLEQVKLLKDDCKIILITSEPGWLTETIVCDKVVIIPEIRKMASIKAIYSLYKTLKENNVDVVVSSSANAGLYSRLARLFLRFRGVYVSHGWSCIYNGNLLKFIFCYIEKLLSNITDVVWCVSQSDADKAVNIIGIKSEKIVTQLNAITPLTERPDRQCQNKIIYVCRLAYPKRPDLILKVAAANPQYDLDIVGDGEYYQELKKEFDSCENIHFYGEIKGFDKFSEYDVFVLTSESEGLPMAAIEATSASLPVILSNVGGCGEVVDQNGILIENTTEELESALNTVFANYDSFYKAAQKQKNKFDINNVKDKCREIILGPQAQP
ncbi:glycosyltransferase [Yersinia alsatica]|uniref:Glycosyltransferase n=1 Tax=Yersinia alsatica TaxID=2890317 RepID=A0ABY5UMU3_9GAMM|nr:glycosyltransferase [Yersinia alsatica]OWF68841.1 glycosyl transferase [Yersinia frederiksenii]UWM44788.1 glycosyltransferase [Yersinia alsatica]CNK98140.1 putative glycosyl transferase [Yersinia frederiksenii]